MLVAPVKNLIFDLGGVILDLSVPHTLEAFSTLSGIKPEEVKERFISSQGFLDYEKGLMGDDEFRDFIRELYKVSATNEQIDACWNAMLRGLPQVMLNLLKKLQETHQVYLLSNTNEIHLSYINATMLPRSSKTATLDEYFHKAYYSHRLLKRKPEPDIFEYVLEENRLIPEQTLFLDDNIQNVEAANSVGIKTVHVTTPEIILNYFHA